MTVALLIPLQDTAENTAGALVIIAATGASVVALWGLLVRFRKSRLSQWVKRRFLIPVRRALIDNPRAEKLAVQRAEANTRILKVVAEAMAPIAAKIEEIAHSTNGKGPGEKTMSAEVTALTESVRLITEAMAAQKLIDDRLTPRVESIELAMSALAGRVDALEGKPHHDPNPQPSASDPLPHRRHDDP